MGTAASDILGYPYVEISSARSTLKKCTVFSSILVFIHFKLILESSTDSGVYLEPYQTAMVKLLAVVFSQKLFIDIRQGSKCGSAASFLNIFPVSFFGYLNEYMKIFLLCSSDLNQKYIFHWFPNHLLYIDHGNTKFSYIYTIEKRKAHFEKLQDEMQG